MHDAIVVMRSNRCLTVIEQTARRLRELDVELCEAANAASTPKVELAPLSLNGRAGLGPTKQQIAAKRLADLQTAQQMMVQRLFAYTNEFAGVLNGAAGGGGGGGDGDEGESPEGIEA